MCVLKNDTLVTIPFSPGRGNETEPRLTQERDCWRAGEICKDQRVFGKYCSWFSQSSIAIEGGEEERMDTRDGEKGEVSKDTFSTAWAGLVHPRNGTHFDAKIPMR